MNIIFSKVVLHNFLSFGDAELDLKDCGTVFVSGVNKNPKDNARSNGSGKSALWDAVGWALTGTTIRGVSKEVANINTSGGCYVELYFNIDGVEYAIKRYKDHCSLGNSVKFFVNNNDVSGKGIRDTEKIIQEYLPDVTSSLVGSVIILGQGLPQRFSNNTPSGRKEVLETLSKSDYMIEDIKKKLSVRRDNLSNEINAVRDTLITVSAKANMTQSQLDDTKTKLDKLVLSTDEDLNQKETFLSTLKCKLSELLEKKAQKNDDISCKTNELSTTHASFSKELETIKDTYKNSLDSMYQLVVKTDLEVKNIEREINKIQNIQEFCPTCGQRIPDFNRPDVKPLQESLKKNTDMLTKYINQYEETLATQNKELQHKNSEYNSKIAQINDQISSFKRDLSSLERSIDEVMSQVSSTTVEVERIKTEIKTYNDKRNDLICYCEKLTTELEKYNEEILYNNTKESSLKLHIDTVNKMLSIATREFRGYLLQNVIEFINRQAKDYCSSIFGSDLIDFCLDGNNINISYNNKLYESLSSGERVKCDIIVQLSIRSMLCSFNNFSSNILVLDEVFDGLDSLGCEQIIKLLSEKLTDIESIFVVSHRADLPISYDRTLVVEKDSSGISKICRV